MRSDIFFVAIIFVFLTIIFTYPIVLNMDKIPMGQDHGQFIWNFWYFKKSLSELQLPCLYTDYLNYPYGGSLVFSTTSELNSIISIPFQMIFGIVQTYNMILMFTFVLSGVSTYLLVKYLTKCKISAFVSGFIFAFSPYLITRIYGGHLNMLSVGWIPLYVLYIIKMIKKPCKKNIFLAALFLSFTCLSSWQYGLFLFVFTTFYLFYHFIFNRKEILNKKTIVNLGIFFLFFVIITSPFLIPKIAETIEHSYMKVDMSASDSSLLSLDLLSPITPAFSQAITKDFSLKPSMFGFDSFTDWETTGYIGFTVIFLLLFTILFYFIYKDKKYIGFWIFSFIMFFVLALGPYLYIAGEYKFADAGFSVPLPYTLFQNYFPFFSIGRGPSRLIVLVVLSASVIVGYGLKEIFNFVPIFFERKLSKICKNIKPKFLKQNISKIFKIVICLVIISLIFVEYHPCPITITEVGKPDFYNIISDDQSDYAIVDIPRGIEAITMYYQTIHGKKIVNGQFSRQSQMERLYTKNNAIRALYWLELDKFNLTKEDFLSLRNISIKYLIVHKYAFLTPQMLEILNEIRNRLNTIFEGAYYEDEYLLVYNLYKLD